MFKQIFKPLLVLLLTPGALVIGQDITVSVPDTIKGIKGDTYELNIGVSDLSPYEVPNFDFEISFDSNLLHTNTSMISKGEMLGQGFVKNVTDDDRIIVSYASSNSINGAGTLFTIDFELRGVGEASVGLEITEMLLGDGSYSVEPDIPHKIAAKIEEHSGVDEIREIPKGYELKANYPNPFNPTTNIQFSLPVNGPVKLEIYNEVGQKIDTIVNSMMPAGTHTFTYDAYELNSGIYFYRLKADQFTQVKKMTLLK